jgi:single-stranded-DNA-specific exonuclease
MLEQIKKLSEEFLKESENKQIRVISHHDTDGITSASIIAKTLKRLDKKFSIRIVKNLEKEIIEEETSDSNKLILFTDLASGSIEHLEKIENKIFILDHHEISNPPKNPNIRIANPHLTDSENVCGAAMAYLFSIAISEKNKDLSKLAIIGMIGDRHEKNINRIYQKIIQDSEGLEIKKSLLIFSATRPLGRSLEYSTSTYIPGITGNSIGVKELLKETKISYSKSLCDLNEKELSNLTTAILLRRSSQENPEDIIGNIYLLKFFNRKEDIREISVLINACSRLGNPDIAISFCLENAKAKEYAQDIYLKYKQELISGLKIAEELNQIKGQGYVILNAQDQIKDAIIGTVCSMLSSAPVYENGTILIGMAYNQDKVKVSARISGQGTRNLKQVLEKATLNFEAEVGGHEKAAGCLIKKEDEKSFMQELQKNLDIEFMKV